MDDKDCVTFLQWCLPQIGLRWAGFRKVRRTVCKRVARRMRELGLADTAAYKTYLSEYASEWARLEVFCHIPIWRFWRDGAVFDWLAEKGLPRQAETAAQRSGRVLRRWSAGCASGEEPYSLRMAWARKAEIEQPSMRIEIMATDSDQTMIARARVGRYSGGSLRNLPSDFLVRCFVRDGDLFDIRPELCEGIAFELQDLRQVWPEGPFDIVLCRNTAFTYFDADGQRDALERISERLRSDGLLIVGGHERLPKGGPAFASVADSLSVYRRANQGREKTSPS